MFAPEIPWCELDETALRAGLAIYAKGLDEMRARKARLSSERDGADRVVVPSELLDRPSPEFVTALDSERRLFELRATARRGRSRSSASASRSSKMKSVATPPCRRPRRRRSN